MYIRLVLVTVGGYIPQTEWLKQPTFIFRSTGGREVKDKAPDLVSGEDLFPALLSSCVLTWWGADGLRVEAVACSPHFFTRGLTHS